jgi:hypothetical protein
MCMPSEFANFHCVSFFYDFYWQKLHRFSAFSVGDLGKNSEFSEQLIKVQVGFSPLLQEVYVLSPIMSFSRSKYIANEEQSESGALQANKSRVYPKSSERTRMTGEFHDNNQNHDKQNGPSWELSSRLLYRRSRRQCQQAMAIQISASPAHRWAGPACMQHGRPGWGMGPTTGAGCNKTFIGPYNGLGGRSNLVIRAKWPISMPSQRGREVWNIPDR